jgi:3-hydroxyisobutyrate dehydrogenase
MTTLSGSGAAKPRIAFIGLGNMGLGMACKIAESGYPTAVYNRTRSKSERAAAVGARIADSPADAARDADVVMMSVANKDVVTAMLFGDNGVRRAADRWTRASWETPSRPGMASCG